jgi:hypothetical protein
VAELLALYRDVETTLYDYGRLTGQHSQALTLKRALAPMIKELENKQA